MYIIMVRRSEDPEFPLAKSKSKAFEQCKEHLNSSLYRQDANGNIIVKLRWELLVQFGTKTQLAKIDKMRFIYVNDLLERHCLPLLDCDTQIIGSRSPKSDMDINMTCPKHMEEVLHGIFEEHESRYPGISLEELFDVNIYGSVFHYLDERCDARRMTLACYPRYEMGYRQRMWSFLRIVEMCETYLRGGVKDLIAEWPIHYADLYKDTKVLYMQQKRRKPEGYIRAISSYMKELGQPTPDPHKIAEAFSKSKVLEHDTYRSIGAVLHIVEHKKNMNASSMYDSCYDNLGFVFQALLKESLCGKGVFINKVIKCAKYFERIYDAVCHINAKTSDQFHELNIIAAEINKKRKALVSGEEMRTPVEALLRLIGCDGKSDETDVLRAYASLLFSVLKPDRTLTAKPLHEHKS